MNMKKNLMLLSHLCEYACKWAHKCNLAPIHNGHKKFGGVRKHCTGVCRHYSALAKIKNMLLKFARKAYSQNICKQW